MQCRVAALLLCSACLSGAEASGHPISKVIDLLQETAEKAKHQRQEEEVTYGKFVHWCSTSTKTLEDAVEEERAKIQELEGIVDAKTKMAEELELAIKELDVELKKMEEAAKKATEQRKEGNKIYEEKSADLDDTIKAIDKAIDILKKAGDDTALVQEPAVRDALQLLQMFAPEKYALLQVEKYALLQDPVLAKGDQKSHVKKYTFKSGSVIELLKGLADDFAKQRLETEKAETNAVNSFALEEQARDAAIAATEKDKEAKESALGETKEALAEAKASLETTQGELTDDSAALEDTKKSCSMKATEWEERTAVYDGQDTAIAEAIKILAKVTGVRTEAPSNPVPPPSPMALQTAKARALALLQFSDSDPKARVIGLLKAAAQNGHSKSLLKLADAVAAKLSDGSGDNKVFEDVIHMITQMILRLQAEQRDENDHKAWCDAEIEKTNSSIPLKQDAITELATKIEEAQAKVQMLAEEIKEAFEMSQKLQEHMDTLTEIRKVGHEENKVATKDAQDAQTAVTSAIAVLEDFYKGAALLQRGVDLPEKPEAWDSSATAVSDPAAQPDGIITVLKEVSSDFAKMEADTNAQEATDAAAYKTELEETNIEREKRAKETEMKTQKKQQLIDDIKSMEKKKKGLEGELYALEVYMKDLEPACIKGDSTYEERKQHRSDEVDALKEARGILKKAFKKDGFLQRK